MATIPRGQTSGIIASLRGKSFKVPRISKILGITSLAIVVLLVLFKLAGDSLYEYEKNPDFSKLSKSAVIACLAGGKGRIQPALKLFQEGNGFILFIAGAGPKSDRDKILRNYLKPVELESLPADRKENIHVENQSRNTIENAYAIARFLRNNSEINEVVLVTSAYHMRRSLLILESALSEDIKVHPYTPTEGSYSKENWLASWIGIRITLQEYLKYLLARVFVPLLEIF